MSSLVLFIVHFHKLLSWHLSEIRHEQGQPEAVLPIEETVLNQHPPTHAQPPANILLGHCKAYTILLGVLR